MKQCRGTVAFAAFIMSGCVLAADPQSDCPIRGEVVHWIADFCMAKIGTDDEIPASDCIAEQIPLASNNACHAKEHYKRALCALAISNGSVHGPIEQCVNDPGFRGSTVRKGGVGGY